MAIKVINEATTKTKTPIIFEIILIFGLDSGYSLMNPHEGEGITVSDVREQEKARLVI